MYDGVKFAGIFCGLISIISGIIILCGFSKTEVELYYSTETIVNYYAVLGGIFAIFNGIFVFVLALAVGDAAAYSKKGYNELKTSIDALANKIEVDDVRNENAKPQKIDNIKKYKKCDACGELNDIDNFFCDKCDHYLSDDTIISKER